MSVALLRSQLSTVEQALARRSGQRDQLVKELTQAQDRSAMVSSEARLEDGVLDILNKTSAAAWQTTKHKMETLVGRALRAVFHDRDYQFVIEQEIKRGASSINFHLVEGDVSMDVWDDGGLGVADVIGFALRIAFLATYKPRVRQVLFVDEPFKNLSVDYMSNASRFMRQVSKELDIQLVIITHNSEFVSDADQVIRLDKKDGVCYATDQTIHG